MVLLLAAAAVGLLVGAVGFGGTDGDTDERAKELRRQQRHQLDVARETAAERDRALRALRSSRLRVQRLERSQARLRADLRTARRGLEQRAETP